MFDRKTLTQGKIILNTMSYIQHMRLSRIHTESIDPLSPFLFSFALFPSESLYLSLKEFF